MSKNDRHKLNLIITAVIAMIIIWVGTLDILELIMLCYMLIGIGLLWIPVSMMFNNKK